MVQLFYDLYYDGILVMKDVEVIREYNEVSAFESEFHFNYLLFYSLYVSRYLFSDVSLNPSLFTFRNLHSHV